MKKRVQRITLVLLAAVITASVLTHPQSENRDTQLLVGAEINPGVLAALERACRDCHSDATHYPWYSYIAPVSWLIEADVARGRERLNLSRWSEYSILRRERCLSEITNQVKDGEMPLRLYTFMHRSAQLSRAETDAIFQWTQAERARLIAESAGGNKSK